MYNDYYLSSIDSRLSTLNNNIDTLNGKIDTLNAQVVLNNDNNIECNNYIIHGLMWIFLFLIVILWYLFLHNIFAIKNRR